MVDISTRVSHLLFVLIAIYIVHNEARKITSNSVITSTEAIDAVKFVNANDEKLLKSSAVDEKIVSDETQKLKTAVVATQQAARESKYSYFYVGRWTWHIPLWFTLWFSFYVFFNVIRSIYGHTINPDDYARRKRDIRDSPSVEDIDRITNFAIKSFDKFKNKNR